MAYNFDTAAVMGEGRPTATQGMPQTSGNAGVGDNSWGSYLGGLIGPAANIWGQQNATQAATEGNNAAIGTATGTLGNINSLYSPQYQLGSGAFNTLGSTLGTNGQPANYNNFLNMPGYQFAVQQGTQAIDRQATAMGNAYTPNTAAAVGQYVTGTAMQDYNTYVNQLMGAGNFGAQANSQLGNLSFNTGQNIGQLQANIGQNRAGGYAGVGGYLGGPNGSGMINNVGGLIGKGLNYLGGMFGGGGGGGDTSGGGVSDMSGFNTPGDMGTAGGGDTGNFDAGNYWDTGGPG